jgi:3-isopropylmalate/(R)-2-methylmalate dehydratase large subunit
VDAHAGTTIDQAYIGACTGAKLDDLRMVAELLEGRRIADDVRLFVAPASLRIAEQAERDGTLETLRAAGARILHSACGACIGLGPARLGAGEVGISSSSRNFQGRMGDPSSKTYLSSPYTVAASALAGCIADPRSYL